MEGSGNPLKGKEVTTLEQENERLLQATSRKGDFVALSADRNAPTIVENEKKKWVLYGEQDEWYKYLIDCANNSPTNTACVRGIGTLIYGKGITFDALDMETTAQVQRMLRANCVRKVAKDQKLAGHAYYQVCFEEVAGVWTPVQFKHVRVECIRPGRTEQGYVDTYYFSADWSQHTKAKYRPKAYPRFGDHTERISEDCKYAIIPIESYETGSFYFTPADYQSGLVWAEVEIEHANLHVNNLRNGMFPGLFINVNSGSNLSEEAKEQIKADIRSGIRGTDNTGRAWVNFNRDKDHEVTVQTAEQMVTHEGYSFLEDAAQRKIMLAHRVTSPMIFGIRDSAGLGNNAEELKNSFTLFQETVIEPFQRQHLEALQEAFLEVGIQVNMAFENLLPEEFIKDLGAADKAEAQTTEMSAQKDMTLTDEVRWLAYLDNKAEILDEADWEEVYEEAVSDPNKEATATKFLKAYSNPQDVKKGDTGTAGNYLLRYRYGPQKLTRDKKTGKVNSRLFCQQMVAGAKKKYLYRLEDILKMGDDGVNGQFAPKGKSTYSIWEHMGGVACHHRWYRVIFKRKTDNGKVRKLTDKEKEQNMRELDKNYDKVGTGSAKTAGVPASKLEPKGWDNARTRPIDRPGKGSLQ